MFVATFAKIALSYKMSKLLLLIIIIEIRHSNSSICTPSKSVGPLRLKEYRAIEETTTESQTRVVLYTYPRKIRALITYRFRYTGLCSSGLWGDVKCDVEIKEENPPLSEAIKWAKTGVCLVGDYCNPRGECYGSGSSETCKKKYTEYKNIGRANFLFADEPLPTPFAHSCSQDWKCSVIDTMVPIEIKIVDGRTKIFTAGPSGDLIEMNSETVMKGHQQEGSHKIYFPGYQAKAKSEEVNATCSGNTKNRIICAINVNTGMGERTIVTEIDSQTLKGANENYMIRIIGKMKIFSNGKIVEIQGRNRKRRETENDFKATSINDLRKVNNEIESIQMQIDYNSISLMNDIIKTQNILLKVIKSVAKIDDKLLPSLLNINGVTRWTNDEIFHILLCDELPADGGLSNCHKGMRYDYGRWKPQTYNKESICFSEDEGKISEISLYNNTLPDSSFFHLTEPEGASLQWDGWSKLLEDQTSTFDAIYNFKTEENERMDKIEQLVSNPWSTIKECYGFLSSIVGWVALILHYNRR